MSSVVDHRSVARQIGLRAKFHALIDPADDQIQMYPLDETAIRGTIVLGARTIEERQDLLDHHLTGTRY